LQLSIQNWQDHLCDFLEVEEVGKLLGHLETIRSGGYSELDPSAKLDILHELVDRALTSDVIRGQLDEYIEEYTTRVEQHDHLKYSGALVQLTSL